MNPGRRRCGSRRDRSQWDAIQASGFPGDYVAFLNSSAQYAIGLVKALGFNAETEIGERGYRLTITR